MESFERCQIKEVLDFVVSMPEIERLSSYIGLIGLGFVEQERIPREIVEVDIHLHVAYLSSLNTKKILDRMGVERSRTAIHN